MSSTSIILIVAATLLFDLVVIVVIFRLKRKKKEMTTGMFGALETKGWRVETGGEKGRMYRATGVASGGLGWEMEGWLGKQKRGTVWRVPAEGDGRSPRLLSDIIAIGPFSRVSGLATPDEIDLGHRMIQTALARIFGKEAAALLAQGRLVELPGDVSGPWGAFSTDAELTRRFLADPVAPILRQWHEGKEPTPSILFWHRGLELRFREVVLDPDVAEQIVTLGEVLLLRCEEIVSGAPRP